MKLSIIIPFKQYTIYLEDCLHSLALSKFKDFETILVLDHNEENVDDIVNKYKDEIALKVFSSDEETGTGAARNKGLKEAQGDYVYFLDCDDYVLEDTLGNLDIDDRYDVYAGMNIISWYKRINFLDSYNEKAIQDECDALKNKYAKYAKHYDKSGVTGNAFDSLFYIGLRGLDYDEVSALNLAIRRSLLLDHNIQFGNYLYYSDQPFIAALLNSKPTLSFKQNSFYIKRKHTDPYNYPALSQIDNDDVFNERIASYKDAISICKNNGKSAIELQLCIYAGTRFSKKLRRTFNQNYKKAYYKALQPCIAAVDKSVYSLLNSSTKTNINCMKKNDKKGIVKNEGRELAKERLKYILKTRNLNGFYKTMYYRKYIKEPIKENVVMFETFFGRSYSDSPKYIYEYLAKNYPGKYKFVWVLNNGTKPPYGGEVVKRFSLKYAYYLAVSKYLVFNVRQPKWYRKREGQVFLETWHGTPLKKLVFDQEEVMAATPRYKIQFHKQREAWDYLVSANSFSTETLARCFMFEKEMLDYGYPRNDILYAPDKDEIAMNLKKKLGIPLDKKTILYAPTWRDDESYGSGQYKFTLALDLKRLKEEFSDEYVVLLRTHYFIADKIDVTGLEGFVYNLSDYDDIAEIYLISDICMTDYSSVFFDFANLRRPILFYTYDLEKYRDQLRGFYISIEEDVPGPLLYTNDDVVNAIKNIDKITEEYADKYEVFYNRFCDYDDGNASKRICERVFGK